MPTKASRQRILVVPKLPQRAPKFLTYGDSIITRMTGNSWFPKPSPSLAKLKAALAALNKAEAATLTRKMGTRTARDAALGAARRLFQQLASYVQKIADANPDDARAIIESSGMSAKKGPGSRAHVLEVERDGVSGSARITAPVAADRATYHWQMSTNGGKTWTDFARTTTSTAPVKDLTPGTTVLFRYKTLTRKGESDWSNPIAYFVD